MNFNFPAKIRLQIYEELLVLPEPILLTMNLWYVTQGPPSSCITHTASAWLIRPCQSTALLWQLLWIYRSRAIHRRWSYCLISQTGQNARFLRHIRIYLPVFNNYQCPALREDSIKTLELIRDNCTGIVILETLLDKLPLECNKDATLELVNARFKAIPSLKDAQLRMDNQGCRRTIKSIRRIRS